MSFLSRLGPGLLYAGAAVGVSHLVQSTRAGAEYGWVMVLVVVLANLIKYPFFKAGPIYAIKEKRSLLEAFRKQGKWSMALFYLVTFSGMFVVQAVVTLLTASVVASIFDFTLPLWIVCALLLSICSLVLLIGRYRLLDNVMKTVIVMLTVTTIVTLLAAVISDQQLTESAKVFSFFEKKDIFFLIALIGWMPAPLDISLWHSEWTLSAMKLKGGTTKLAHEKFDFKVGYWGTSLLAIAFVGLGAIVLRGSGTELPSSGVAFSGQLISMYTNTLGSWSFLFIALAAFTTMFSTTLTVLDAYPRVLSKALALSFPKRSKYAYPGLLFLLVLGAVYVLKYRLENMKQLVDFATTVSFLTAPVLASLIYNTVKKSKHQIFNKTDEVLVWCGLIFLYCFAFYYFVLKYWL